MRPRQAAAAACASQLSVRFTCSPDGASLFQANGQRLGQCPVDVQYPITSKDRDRGYASLQGVTARWASGATSSISTITAYLERGPFQKFHFERPNNNQGSAADLEYAARFNQERRAAQEAEERAKARQDRNALASLGCTLASMRTNQPLTTNLECHAAYLRGSSGEAETTSLRKCAQTGHAYDARSGNSYMCSKQGEELHLTGFNAETGNRWNTYFSANGDMRGVDAGGNSWRYTASNAVYDNYGTGRRCVGTGVSRTCTP